MPEARILERSPLVNTGRDQNAARKHRTGRRHHRREQSGAVQSLLEQGCHGAEGGPHREVSREKHAGRYIREIARSPTAVFGPNAKTNGRADGSIMATIITVHIRNVAAKSME